MTDEVSTFRAAVQAAVADLIAGCGRKDIRVPKGTRYRYFLPGSHEPLCLGRLYKKKVTLQVALDDLSVRFTGVAAEALHAGHRPSQSAASIHDFRAAVAAAASALLDYCECRKASREFDYEYWLPGDRGAEPLGLGTHLNGGEVQVVLDDLKVVLTRDPAVRLLGAPPLTREL